MKYITICLLLFIGCQDSKQLEETFDLESAGQKNDGLEVDQSSIKDGSQIFASIRQLSTGIGSNRQLQFE